MPMEMPSKALAQLKLQGSSRAEKFVNAAASSLGHCDLVSLATRC